MASRSPGKLAAENQWVESRIRPQMGDPAEYPGRQTQPRPAGHGSRITRMKWKKVVSMAMGKKEGQPYWLPFLTV